MDSNPTPQQILAINPLAQGTEVKPPSTGWTIFWLLMFPPVGWYRVWRSGWPIWVKVTAILLSAALYLALAIETELIAGQITSIAAPSDLGL